MQELVDRFIKTANAFDIDGVVSLFASDAIIDDVSVGDVFVGKDGVRLYLERFFVGYNTSSRLLSVERIGDRTVRIRLDFTGDFGHEIGVLRIAVNLEDLIERIDADLE